jgi:hypothetical protein
MTSQDKVHAGILVGMVTLLVWFIFQLFHFKHYYKIKDKQNTTYTVYVDSEYEVGDKLLINKDDLNSTISEDFAAPRTDTITVYITKILR